MTTARGQGRKWRTALWLFLLLGLSLASSSEVFSSTRQGDLSKAQKKGGERTRLGVEGTRFTLNGRPTFLLGFSYYGALGAPEKTIRRDLTALKEMSFNWLRVWATWAAFEHDVSAVDRAGRPRAEHLKKLQQLVSECDRLGFVVDVSLSRGNGVSGPARLQTAEAQRAAVTVIVEALKPHRNWYLDLSNERNIKDERFTTMVDLGKLRESVRRLDPDRLVTASHAGEMTAAQVKEYVDVAKVDFLAPHRPRRAGSPKETEKMTRQYLAWAKDAGRVVPVHYQEPFRRGFGKWQPTAEDFLTDLRGAVKSGAAGWCFHNGDQRDRADGRPRRSFDLRESTLLDQLDEVESEAIRQIAKLWRKR
jgi:hypothetical protein